MTSSKYTLRYLPIFYDDLEETISYIADNLMNVEAAKNLLTSVENAILERLPNAESFEQYHSKGKRKQPYYRIYVGNYTIYYVVLHEDNKSIMEVRRFL